MSDVKVVESSFLLPHLVQLGNGWSNDDFSAHAQWDSVNSVEKENLQSPGVTAGLKLINYGCYETRFFFFVPIWVDLLDLPNTMPKQVLFFVWYIVSV